MVYFIYSDETASSNIAASLRELLSLKEVERNENFHKFYANGIHMIGIKGKLINAEFIDNIVDGTIIFLSRHSSSKGIPAFTVHSEGNWSKDVSLGGLPKKLSVSSPYSMFKILNSINSVNSTDIEVTYEATHHGPFTNNPSFFVELGGNEDTINSKFHAELLSKAIASSLEKEFAYDKIAVGFGGMHYAMKFTKLAINGNYAFSHIMPKYQITNLDMIKSAFEQSDLKPEIGVIEWKGIKAVDRESIIRELSVLGIDYAKV